MVLQQIISVERFATLFATKRFPVSVRCHMPLQAVVVLRSLTTYRTIMQPPSCLMYDVRLISISALGLKTFSVETKNVFYNDFWVPPPSLVQGHKLCREKVTMDTVCYEGGLICLGVSSHYITSLVCNQVQLQIIFSFKVFSTFGTLEPSKWMVSGVVSSEITHV